MIRTNFWRLCFIADSEAAADQDVLRLIRQAALGGATMIQLRGKAWTTRQFLATGRKAGQILIKRRIPLIINDRIDIALACPSRGVHLGQLDMPISEARRILGRRALIGISASTPAEARRAEREGADYLGIGPVFETASKKGLPEALGIAGFKAIRRQVGIPVLAIGGIGRSNVLEIMKAGADGVAVISAISSAHSPIHAARELIEIISRYENRPSRNGDIPRRGLARP